MCFSKYADKWQYNYESLLSEKYAINFWKCITTFHKKYKWIWNETESIENFDKTVNW